jgi:hypothetical protein
VNGAIEKEIQQIMDITEKIWEAMEEVWKAEGVPPQSSMHT